MRDGAERERQNHRRNRRARRRAMSQIPTAGMADIAFLLLIFFMLIVYESDRTQVDLPDSDIRVGAAADAALVILAVGQGGPSDVIYKFTDGVSESRQIPGLAAVEAEAARVLASNPQALFKIKADGAVSARLVTTVFDALNGAGAVKVLMLTDPRATERAAL